MTTAAERARPRDLMGNAASAVCSEVFDVLGFGWIGAQAHTAGRGQLAIQSGISVPFYSNHLPQGSRTWTCFLQSPTWIWSKRRLRGFARITTGSNNTVL